MKHRSVRPVVLIVLAVAFIATPVLTSSAQASDPFIVMFGGNFAPRGRAQCDGQLLPISQNTALFSILGTTYGGDGRTSFGLPDLRGRMPMHRGNGPGLTPRSLGQKSGQEHVTLNTTQIPAHNHSATGVVRATSAAGNSEDPAGNVLAQENREDQYRSATPDVDMAANTVSVSIGNAGGSQSHDNMPPFEVVNFIIALVGVFPS